MLCKAGIELSAKTTIDLYTPAGYLEGSNWTISSGTAELDNTGKAKHLADIPDTKHQPRTFLVITIPVAKIPGLHQWYKLAL